MSVRTSVQSAAAGFRALAEQRWARATVGWLVIVMVYTLCRAVGLWYTGRWADTWMEVWLLTPLIAAFWIVVAAFALVIAFGLLILLAMAANSIGDALLLKGEQEEESGDDLTNRMRTAGRHLSGWTYRFRGAESKEDLEDPDDLLFEGARRIRELQERVAELEEAP